MQARARARAPEEDRVPMNINFTYNSSVGNAPAEFTAALNQVASFFSTNFVDPITVRISVGWGEVRGQALAAGARKRFFRLAAIRIRK